MLEVMLLKEAEKANKKPFNKEYTAFSEANALLCDLLGHPHAFLLACIADRQCNSEKTWLVPYKMKKVLGDFELTTLNKLSQSEIEKIFKENNLHRFNEEIAKSYYLAIKKVSLEYDGDASKIWRGKPSSATVVLRLLDFYGVGVKIATMIANILARDFGVEYADYYSIDISADTHVRRVFKRMGLIVNHKNVDECIYKARSICPEYPGILDNFIWSFGRTICMAKNPKCEECIFKDKCPKLI